jgi:hypothetical protein
MRVAILRTFLGLLLFCAPGLAKDWPAIAPEVWAIKQDDGPGAHGAVILDHWVRYNNGETEVRQRIRIFGEAGKGAATLPAFNRIYELDGRTVQPDGQVTSFNSAKDLVSASLKVGRWASKRQSLIPPGLTSDCVVDIYYRVGSYIHGNWVELPILDTYPIRQKVLEVWSKSYMGSGLFGLGALRPEQSAKGGYNVFTFRNLPAYEPEPYSLPTASERPMLIFFHQPSMLLSDAARNGPKVYWEVVANKYYKYSHVDILKTGSTYREWSRALRAGLDGDPASKASAILMRLGEQIQNGSQLTFAEFAALTKKAAEEKMEAQDLDATVKRRRTSASGMHYIFFQLLVDEGLDPKLLLVADRNLRVFQFDLPNVYQFTDLLIGVATKSGGFVWFNPSARYFPAGIMNPDFQGTQGLLLNPKNWTTQPYAVGIQTSRANGSLYEYEITLADEERFSMKARFSGFPEFTERNKFFSLEAKEQDRKLKEDMEPNLKAYTITKVMVEHATDNRMNVSWTLEATKEAEEGRRRQFSPFPGLPYPLSMPDAWPETRKSPIVLPFCRVFGAVSKFKVPKGWVLGKDLDFVQSNEFGTVSWKVKTTGTGEEEQTVVSFTVEVKQVISNPSTYASFRSFMEWIESAARRTLTLERQS